MARTFSRNATIERPAAANTESEATGTEFVVDARPTDSATVYMSEPIAVDPPQGEAVPQ